MTEIIIMCAAGLIAGLVIGVIGWFILKEFE